MYRAACVLWCVSVAMGSSGTSVNDFEPAIKVLTGAADPKTLLAVPYFLAETRKADDDSTPKTAALDAHHHVNRARGEKRRVVATEARRFSETSDLSASPTVYRVTADGREYRGASVPNWIIYQSPRKRPQPHRYPLNRLKTKYKSTWEPNVYTPKYEYKENHIGNWKAPSSKGRDTEGGDAYNRQRNHFKPASSVPQVPEQPKIDKRPRFQPKPHVEPERGAKHEFNEDENQGEDEDEHQFVPTRMYAQVRQYESESHLPADAEEPRLRKIAKESRIHAVYMEEGYEDGAYDHAGEEKYAEEDEAQVEHRRRRRHIDFFAGNLKIDTDLGGSEFALGEPNNNAAKKYPYYDQKGVNSNSPLRYAQSMEDIPHKKEGTMAFYDEANAKTNCEEVENVEPIPKDLDAGDENPEKAVPPKLPRLKNLGDKIDCFKTKFFGEEPLDNPLFKEEFVAPPPNLSQDPQFKETEVNLKQGNRIGKRFQPIAVEGTSFSANKGSADNDNDYSHGDDVESSEEPLPEADALRVRRVKRRRKRPHHPNKLHSGQYSAYQPSPNSLLTHKLPRGTMPPTILASPNIISEVYYKNQIKPSEQLNVFADVINHIQNMSRADSSSAATEQRPSFITGAALPSTKQSTAITAMLHIGHRKKLKRKYPLMKSTQQLFTDYVRRSKNSPSPIPKNMAPISQESHISVGPVQIAPSSHDVPNYAGIKDNSETPIHYSTIDLPLNKYLVPGMKPPLAIEKPTIYSDYQSDSALKRKDWQSNYRLSRRKRGTRNNYSEIRRQPTHKPQEYDEEEDTDDYVPHRPTNYHYDPDTDRIVYDEKPTTERSVEEVIEAYFEEEYEQPEEKRTTKTPPPHKTVYHKDVLNKANGKTLVDYLAALRSDPSYKPIEDPKPTKEPSSPTTLKPESTTPPEFIKFLEMLHASNEYKKIENPEDVPTTKKPKTTTTPAPGDVEVEAEVEESVSTGNVQNSPGGQVGQNGGLQIFDINDFLPKVKTYTPKTSIDYSKYKTIERTTSRHSLSSRYSEDDPLERRHFTASPTAAKYQTAPPRPKTTAPPEEAELTDVEKSHAAAATQQRDREEVQDNVISTTTIPTTTSAAKIRVRGRQRSSKHPTRPTTTTTPTTDVPSEKPISNAAVKLTPATHRPPSRVYPRRHRPKIRSRSTTTAAPQESDGRKEESSEVHRRSIRRQNHTIPANHKPEYTPITISKRMDNQSIRLGSRQARLVTPEIINYNQTRGDPLSHPGSISPRSFLRRYNIVSMPIQAETLTHDRNASLVQISDTGDENPLSESISSKRVDALGLSSDRSDNSAATSRIKFIKDPNKRLYFYAPL